MNKILNVIHIYVRIKLSVENQSTVVAISTKFSANYQLSVKHLLNLSVTKTDLMLK